MERSGFTWHLKPALLRLTMLAGVALGFALPVTRVEAFSLIGPHENWMDSTNSFRLPGDTGGPMNLGEEYRWNVPVVTYAFDAAFLNYFGSNGVAAVESAISILNNLPDVSQIDPGSYPPEVTRVNSVALGQGLIDLKSQTLSILLEQLGLASPTRFTYSLQYFAITDGTVAGVVLKRNFDPISFTPTNRVNDTLYSQQLTYYRCVQETRADAVEYPVDPLSRYAPAVADGDLSPGVWFSGLTRDDVGGLKYVLGTNNLNFECLLPGVYGVGTNEATWASQSVRPGIGKVAFVRRDFDSLLTGLWTPYTNQYTDTYITNGTVAHQQVERVATQPDFLFSAGDLETGNAPTPRVARTGTGNWICSSALPGQAGPGLIRPPIRIVFNKPSNPRVQTKETLAPGDFHLLDYQDYRWGSYDATGSIVAYPSGAETVSTNQMVVRLKVRRSDATPTENFTWQVGVPMGGQACLWTSTNLVHWVPVALVNNRGLPVDWEHSGSRSQRFFSVQPQ